MFRRFFSGVLLRYLKMGDKSNSKTQRMETDKIPSLIMRFSLTTFVALFLNALYNIVDSLFVSRGVGDNAMGGVSIVFAFMIIQAAIAQTVGGGAAVLVSRFLGQKEEDKAGEVTLNAMAVFYISALLVSLLGFIFMNPILSFLGATEDVFPYARQYFLIILAGNVFSTGFSSIIRAEGQMIYALLIWLIPTAVNIIFDAVFIFGFKWGVSGAALATVLCQFVSFSMSVVFFLKLSQQKFKGARLSIKTIKEILPLGLPTLVQMSSLSVLIMFLNKTISSVGGTTAINTFAYVSKIIIFAMVPFNAVSQAVSPVVAFNQGAKNFERVKKTLNFSILICLVYALAAMALSQSISPYFIQIFTQNSQLILSGAQAIRITALALPFAPISIILGTYFQARGRKIQAFILNFSILAFMLPITLVFAKLWSVKGVWWSFLPACLLAALLSFAVKKTTDGREAIV